MEDELELYQNAAEEQMQNAVAHLDDTLQHIRAGKANPRILDPIKVDYYGAMSPLANCATITTPDARTIAITPWEKKLIGEIERAIINSNIGLAPSNNGETIRLILPPLTEERRRDLLTGMHGLNKVSFLTRDGLFMATLKTRIMKTWNGIRSLPLTSR